MGKVIFSHVDLIEYCIFDKMEVALTVSFVVIELLALLYQDWKFIR
jgi:hypothetical protein